MFAAVCADMNMEMTSTLRQEMLAEGSGLR